jgi:hypothetical protein
MGLDGLIAGGELALVSIVDFEILLEGKQVLGSVVPGKGGLDFLFRGAAAKVTVSCQEGRIGNPRHDVAKDAQTRDSGDVADHEVELQIHLNERLLHPLNTGARRLDEGIPVTQVTAQRCDVTGGPEAPAKQTDAVKFLKPLGVGDVTLAARHVLDVPRVHEEHLEPAGFQDLEYRDPVHPGRLHGDRRDATCNEPISQPVEISSSVPATTMMLAAHPIECDNLRTHLGNLADSLGQCLSFKRRI